MSLCPFLYDSHPIFHGLIEKLPLKDIREFMADKIAVYKVPDELCNFPDFPRLAGGIKIRKFGPESVQEMAMADEGRERYRK